MRSEEIWMQSMEKSLETKPRMAFEVEMENPQETRP